jgi:hypothetical protein
MNRRLHLMRRIEMMLPHLYSPVMQNFAKEVYKVLQADEDDITDLESRVKFLEDELKRSLPHSPDDQAE